MNAEEVERERGEDGAAGEQKPPGSQAHGEGDGIPNSEDGIGIGAGAEANTFEPEEDPDATDKGNESA